MHDVSRYGWQGPRAIQRLAEYAKSNERIPWVCVYSVAADVYWGHRAQIEAATRLTCGPTCGILTPTLFYLCKAG